MHGTGVEMNNPQTFQLGWYLLFAAGGIGGYVGYRQAMEGRVKREKENKEIHSVKLERELEKLEASMRKQNSKLFRNSQKNVGADIDTPNENSDNGRKRQK